MNPLEGEILNVLQASPDGHSTAFNVFNVLNRDGYNVTKSEFEAACRNLHDFGCIAYQPVYSPLVDIPIGSVVLRTESALLRSEEIAVAIDALNADPAESLAIGRGASLEKLEAEPNQADRIDEPAVIPRTALA